MGNLARCDKGRDSCIGGDLQARCHPQNGGCIIKPIEHLATKDGGQPKTNSTIAPPAMEAPPAKGEDPEGFPERLTDPVPFAFFCVPIRPPIHGQQMQP